MHNYLEKSKRIVHTKGISKGSNSINPKNVHTHAYVSVPKSLTFDNI
jgi:hypothetical protein